jgi:hypothetical protein
LPILNISSEFSLVGFGTVNLSARWSRVLNTFKGMEIMIKLSYLLAAAAAIAIVTPTFAQDAPKAGATINQGAAPTGEVKRDEGRGEMRKEGDRDHGRMEVRGERRDGGERREMRSGVRVELGDRDRGQRRWHRAHAERLVVIHHRHRHHHREM